MRHKIPGTLTYKPLHCCNYLPCLFSFYQSKRGYHGVVVNDLRIFKAKLMKKFSLAIAFSFDLIPLAKICNPYSSQLKCFTPVNQQSWLGLKSYEWCTFRLKALRVSWYLKRTDKQYHIRNAFNKFPDFFCTGI